jgi:hypothetical protein
MPISSESHIQLVISELRDMDRAAGHQAPANGCGGQIDGMETQQIMTKSE